MRTIRAATPDDFDEITEVWESSVRATHQFLAQEDVERLRLLIREQYLVAVDLQVSTDQTGGIFGFVGTADGKIEMLFVAPSARGTGVGKELLARTDAHAVDVNEQNGQAVGFYERMGFRVLGRSELDGQGQPYPLLHMRR